jgi:hypothetical protein
MRPIAALVCLSLASCSLAVQSGRPAQAATPAPCRVRVILFVPADVNPPAEYQRRIDQIADYAESFFRRELKRWGHEKYVAPFHRSADGRVEVTVIRGKQATAQYKPVPVRVEVMDDLRRRGVIDDYRQVWWIMVYAGPPPAKFAGYLGGFGQEIGGWAVCNFDTTPGVIDPQAKLGADFLEKLTLKGMIHELGHGFRLPHIGPLLRDNAGNTLMGPTHVNYRRVARAEEDRVYLSEAEAALFSVHPALRGVADTPQALPTVTVSNLKYAADRAKKTITVTGRVQASRQAIYALVGDESDARPGEYWTKTYVGRVAPDGAFEVVVAEPSESNGTLKTWFVFADGDNTGDGKTRGRESGVSRPYAYRQGQWSFP